MKKIMFALLFISSVLAFGQNVESKLPSDALYILDDKVISYNDIVRNAEGQVSSIKSIAIKKINSIQILKNDAATDKYGVDGKHGVIIFITKKYANKQKKKSQPVHA